MYISRKTKMQPTEQLKYIVVDLIKIFELNLTEYQHICKVTDFPL